MHMTRLLLFVFAFYYPQAINAAGQEQSGYTPEENIQFSNATRIAFDHSGQRVIRSTLADGTQVADHNGSMGNITVARMGADGNIETFCTTDEAAAKAWMAGGGGKKPATSLNAPVMEK